MDAPTAGVLRDISLLVWLALLMGAAAYKWLRQTRPAAAWNWAGKVDARPYITVDGLVIAAVSLLLLGGLDKAGEAAAGTGDSAASELHAGAIFLSTLMTLMICAVLLFYLRGVRNLNPVEIFGLRRITFPQALGKAVVYYLPTLVVVMAASALATHWLQGFWPDVNQQSTVEGFRQSQDPLAKGMLAVAAVIVAPLVEETLFRGFMYGVIKRYTDGWFAALCTALLFGVVHFHIASFIPLVFLGLIFCAAYERTGSLAVPMLMHGFFNGTSLVMLILFPDMK